MEKQQCQLRRPASRPPAWGRRGGPACPVSLQIPHLSPLLFIQQHSRSTCSTQACGGYADASRWQKLRTLSYDIQLDLRHFPDRQGRCNPLRTRRMHVRNRPGPNHTGDNWRQTSGRSPVGLPKQHLHCPADRLSAAEPCSGGGGDAAVILMGEGSTASRTFQQSIALQAMVLTHFRILRAVHTEGPKPVAHRLAESFPI